MPRWLIHRRNRGGPIADQAVVGKETDWVEVSPTLRGRLHRLWDRSLLAAIVRWWRLTM